MHAMGFPEKWVSWVTMCTTSVQYSITHAGHATQFFTATWGLRQGCPFSPYLFILCVEGFSALLKRYEHMGLIHGCKIAREALAISHLFFADYSLIFFRANREESQQIRTCIDLFEWASDQQINSQKFSISFSADTTSQARQDVSNIFGVQQSVTYGQYLGLLSLAGRNKTQIFYFIKDRVWHRIQNWKNRFISRAKEVLIKTIAQALPTYAMSVFLPPYNFALIWK